MRTVILALLIVSIAFAAENSLRGKSKDAPTLAAQSSNVNYHINLEEALKWDEVEVKPKQKKDLNFFSGFFEIVNPTAHNDLPAVEDHSQGQILSVNTNKVSDEELARIQAMPLEKPQVAPQVQAPQVEAPQVQAPQAQAPQTQSTQVPSKISKEEIVTKAASQEASILGNVVKQNEDKKAAKKASHKQANAINRVLKKQTVALQMNQEVIAGDELVDMNRDIEGAPMSENGPLVNEQIDYGTTSEETTAATVDLQEKNQQLELTPHSDKTWDLPEVGLAPEEPHHYETTAFVQMREQVIPGDELVDMNNDNEAAANSQGGDVDYNTEQASTVTGDAQTVELTPHSDKTWDLPEVGLAPEEPHHYETTAFVQMREQVIPGDELVDLTQDIEGVDMKEGALELNDMADYSNSYIQEDAMIMSPGVNTETTPTSETTAWSVDQTQESSSAPPPLFDANGVEIGYEGIPTAVQFIQMRENEPANNDDIQKYTTEVQPYQPEPVHKDEYVNGIEVNKADSTTSYSFLQLGEIVDNDSPVQADQQLTTPNMEVYTPEAVPSEIFDNNGVEIGLEHYDDAEVQDTVSFIQMKDGDFDSNGVEIGYDNNQDSDEVIFVQDSSFEVPAAEGVEEESDNMDISNVTTDVHAYEPEPVPTQEYDSNGVEIGLQSQPVASSFLQVNVAFF